MKKATIGALIAIILIVVIIGSGAGSNGAFTLSYVYSNSMEPLILINDAFLIVPDPNPKVGDIIIYRPTRLDAELITHRIIQAVDGGFVTKGDNSPYADQESGEPLVIPERIVGKVFTVGSKPLIIPGLGNVVTNLNTMLGDSANFLSGIFLVLGLLSILFGGSGVRKRKPRTRLRLRQIYRISALLIVGIVLLTIYIGSQVKQIRYLVSDSPGDLGNQIKTGVGGELSLIVENKGIVPVWNITESVAPLEVQNAIEYLRPLSKRTLIIDVPPIDKVGYYQAYVQAFNYPILMPKSWVFTLHEISPYLALGMTGLALSFWLLLIFGLVNQIPGMHGWIPVKALTDKLAARKYSRIRAEIFGRRRRRS